MIPARILNAEGESLAFSFSPGAPDRRDIVVLGHGLTSDKDRPWSEALAARLADQGVASLRIAFSGNGASGGSFLASTITKEVADLGSVLDALAGWRVAYVGHSLGGAVGLVRAATDERIRALVSLAAVTDAEEFLRRMFGHLEFGEPMLGKAHCPYGSVLESDLLAWGSLARLAREIRVPWLVVHGSADEVVPPHHSELLHAEEPANSEFVTLDGCDHSFSGRGLDELTDRVAPWICRHMSR